MTYLCNYTLAQVQTPGFVCFLFSFHEVRNIVKKKARAANPSYEKKT